MAIFIVKKRGMSSKDTQTKEPMSDNFAIYLDKIRNDAMSKLNMFKNNRKIFLEYKPLEQCFSLEELR